MKKNIGLIITTIIIIAVVVATAAVAMFAGVVALVDYAQGAETETQQAQEEGSEGGAENLGGNQGGSQGESDSSGSETVSIRDEAEFTQEEITGAEMPELDIE